MTDAPNADYADGDLEVLHIRTADGRCVISLNGQGHLPCDDPSHNGSSGTDG